MRVVERTSSRPKGFRGREGGGQTLVYNCTHILVSRASTLNFSITISRNILNRHDRLFLTHLTEARDRFDREKRIDGR